jgi:hypothetical protein
MNSLMSDFEMQQLELLMRVTNEGLRIKDELTAGNALTANLTDKCFDLQTQLAAANAELERVRAERDGLLKWKQSVDESLNSGDGVYRP